MIIRQIIFISLAMVAVQAYGMDQREQYPEFNNNIIVPHAHYSQHSNFNSNRGIPFPTSIPTTLARPSAHQQPYSYGIRQQDYQFTKYTQKNIATVETLARNGHLFEDKKLHHAVNSAAKLSGREKALVANYFVESGKLNAAKPSAYNAKPQGHPAPQAYSLVRTAAVRTAAKNSEYQYTEDEKKNITAIEKLAGSAHLLQDKNLQSAVQKANNLSNGAEKAFVAAALMEGKLKTDEIAKSIINGNR